MCREVNSAKKCGSFGFGRTLAGTVRTTAEMQRHHVSRSRIQRVHEEHFSRNISLTQCECASAPKHFQTELGPLIESHISGLVEAWQGICRPTTKPTTIFAKSLRTETPVQVHMAHACCVGIGWRSPSEQFIGGTMVGTVRRQFLAV